MKTNFFKVLCITLFSILSMSNLYATQNKTIIIDVPRAPKVQAKVPSVIVIQNSQQVNKTTNTTKTSAIGGSKRVPPNYYKQTSNTTIKNTKAGEVKNSRVSAYLQTSIITKEELTQRLQSAGFKILGEYKVDKKANYISMIFTNDELTKMASKTKRGFSGSIRLLIDKKNSQISILNPLYVNKAFMQDNYDEKVTKKTLKDLHSIFSDLKDSKDIVKFARLNRYQFMQNMPHYQDMIKVAIGENKKLLKKARKSKKIIYEHHLDNGSVVIGVKLSRRTSKFVKKTGYQNSELLPYPILIEDNVAKILAPKYYIAIMYPNLSMSEFMTIATIPGAIQKDCDKVFR
ncbi:hypothetical protein [Sulfurimonas sp.]|uniref:hypothetical protein n=1 Tax=Sulfurimonas sp. TaxID=2022749 RepID=UPI002AB09113|nr:hypothetical protein [Sulfurimonas sp.]